MVPLPSVLVVDDDATTRSFLSLALKRASFSVEASPDAAQARLKLAEKEFDVAFVDRLLPGERDGLDLVKHINGVQPFCQVILVSASPSFESAAEAIRDSIFAYLSKPLKKSEVIETARRAFERKELLRASRHREMLFDSLFGHSPVAIAIYDEKGRTRFVNPAFTRLLGYELHEAPRFPLPGMPPSEVEDAWRDFEEALEGKEAPEREAVWTTRDGGKVNIATTLSLCRDEEGRLTDVLALMRDVTEARRLEQQVRQSQKMEAIGTLASGIAHDFNNILGVVFGYVELALDSPAGDPELRAHLERIRDAAGRARDLVKQMLTMSRQGEHEPRPIELHFIVKEAFKMLRASLPPRIEMRHNVSPFCGFVLADPTRMHQIVMNLCTNAYHAMAAQGGVLEIELEKSHVDSPRIGGAGAWKKGDYVRLTVRDTGCGMDAETLERAFDPFFTTKPESEGTGLGLSVVQGIVKDCGGFITVDSAPGKGTAFHIHLPCIDPRMEEGCDIRDPFQATALPGPERVLVVDDEKEIARTAEKNLAKAGYRATACFSGPEAMERFLEAPHEWDLVVTDWNMPVLNGVHLALRIQALRPDLPIILATGSTTDPSEEPLLEFFHGKLIRKPYTTGELTLAMRKLLDSEEGEEA